MIADPGCILQSLGLLPGPLLSGNRTPSSTPSPTRLILAFLPMDSALHGVTGDQSGRLNINRLTLVHGFCPSQRILEARLSRLEFGSLHRSPRNHQSVTYQARHATFTGREVEGIGTLSRLLVSLILVSCYSWVYLSRQGSIISNTGIFQFWGKKESWKFRRLKFGD